VTHDIPATDIHLAGSSTFSSCYIPIMMLRIQGSKCHYSQLWLSMYSSISTFI